MLRFVQNRMRQAARLPGLLAGGQDRRSTLAPCTEHLPDPAMPPSVQHVPPHTGGVAFMHQRRSTGRRTLPALIASLLLLGACTSGGGGDTGQSATGAAASSDRLDLRGVCPSTIVVQTSWDPSIESFGALYALLGPNPQIDAKQKRVTAPLTTTAEHKNTGVQLELRAGGPAIGFEQATAQLYSHPDIHLAVPNATDEVIQLSKTQPTLAVLALVDIDPQLILWDPKTHPEWNIIADIGQSDAKVLYFGGDTYMEYLIGSGILKKSQVDGSFDGSPARFVAEKGKVAQSGYATSDPYVLEHIPEWGKPVKFQLVYDTGYPNYGSLLSIRSRDKDKLAPCLKKLIPIVQQSQVDVHSNPQLEDQVIAQTLKIADAYDSKNPYTTESAKFAITQEKQLGLTGNGTGNGTSPDTTIGNFNMDRVQKLIAITQPIFAAEKKPIKDGLQPSDVATNEFINPAIGMKQ
jgi:hypothetical protein